MSKDSAKEIQEKVLTFYDQGGREQSRLLNGIGPLQFTRTKEVLQRFLPSTSAVVVDIGGGPGVYSLWLARLGYESHLVDLAPLHIEQAKEASANQKSHPIKSFHLGDSRNLDFEDNFADVVIIHGPLYHLQQKKERLDTLSEAKRILKPGGLLFSFYIPCYASTHVGLTNGWIEDEDYFKMVKLELSTGKHVRPKSWPRLFVDAYFHRPEEIEEELVEAGFIYKEKLAIEGQGWLAKDFDLVWNNPQKKDRLLELIRITEKDPVSIGLSPHIVAISEKRF